MMADHTVAVIGPRRIIGAMVVAGMGTAMVVNYRGGGHTHGQTRDKAAAACLGRPGLHDGQRKCGNGDDA
jgi:hypothetical protein